jgi:drug/metabolite transporter (DMT)-like permease
MKECDTETGAALFGSGQQFSKSSRLAAVAQDKASSLRLALAYLVCSIVWGTTWYAIRLCVAPGAFAPSCAAAIRFTLSSIFFVAVWLFLPESIKKVSRSSLIWVLLCGVLGALGYVLVYNAEQNISGGLASVLSATTPIFAALLASITRVERISRSALIGSFVAIWGVVIVFLDRLQISTTQATAATLMVLNCAISALSSIGLKHHAHNLSAWTTNAIFFSSVSFWLWVSCFFSATPAMPQRVPPNAILALAYLTIAGTIAFICYFYMLKHVRLSTAMTLSFIVPVLALLIDAFLEKTVCLSSQAYLGMVIVLLGVATSIVPKFKIA